MGYWFDMYCKLLKKHIGLRQNLNQQILANTNSRKAKRILQETIDSLVSKNRVLKLKNKGEKRCDKAVFYNEDEAHEFAKLVGRRTNQLFTQYICGICSEKGKYIYHITHTFRSERGKF